MLSIYTNDVIHIWAPFGILWKAIFLRGDNVMFFCKRAFNFLQQSTRRKLLFSEAIIGFTILRVLSFVLPFRIFSKLIGVSCSENDMDPTYFPGVLKDVAWAANRACVVAPWGKKCLINALTAKWLSRQFGVRTTYYLGVGKDDDGKLIYHAWLKYGKYVVSGGNVSEEYKVLGSFR